VSIKVLNIGPLPEPSTSAVCDWQAAMPRNNPAVTIRRTVKLIEPPFA
jgi:hypothetical protein